MWWNWRLAVDSRSPIFGSASWTKGIESRDVFPSKVTGGLATTDDIDYRGGMNVKVMGMGFQMFSSATNISFPITSSPANDNFL